VVQDAGQRVASRLEGGRAADEQRAVRSVVETTPRRDRNRVLNTVRHRQFTARISSTAGVTQVGLWQLRTG